MSEPTPRTLDSSVCFEPALAPAQPHVRRWGDGLRSWLGRTVLPADTPLQRAVIFAVLLLAPLIVYSPAVFHYYALRDSYSNLREAHEEPGKLVQFCGSQARPIYGWLLQTVFRYIDTIRQLEWIRALSTLLLGTVSVTLYQFVRRIGWSRGGAFLLALWIVFTPPAQVIAGWAIGWPYALAAWLGVVAFAVAESDFQRRDRLWVRAGLLLTAVALVATSALIYQPSTLFYAVPWAAMLVVRRHRSVADFFRWCIRHLLTLGAGLGAAYASITVCYAYGVFRRSPRVAFEHDWLGKLGWFVSEPLPNALSPFVLNDDHGRDHTAFALSAAVVFLVLVAGAVRVWRRNGGSRGLTWALGLLGLPVLAFSVSLIARERYATYRTIFSLTGVLLCFLIAAAKSVLSGWELRLPRRALAIVAAVVAMCFAEHHAYALLAVPQGNEWNLMLAGAEQVHLGPTRPSVFVIEPSDDDISTESTYQDEFGSLSTNSDWVPKEMFKRAMHDLHPSIRNLDQRYLFSSGEALPTGRRFDVVIDLHHLRDFRAAN